MSETLQILEKLNSFYAGAFGQLVTYTVGILALVGVLIPTAIASFQNRQLKRDQNALSAQISAELLAAKTHLNAKLAEEIAMSEAKLKEFVGTTRAEIAEEITKIDELAKGRALHLQALTTRENSPSSSVFDCLSAVPSYVKGGDERNLRAVLIIFEDECARVYEDDFKILDIEDAKTLAVESLKPLNTTGRYTQDIRMINVLTAEAKQRKRPATTAG